MEDKVVLTALSLTMVGLIALLVYEPKTSKKADDFHA
jgi:hypothetical protein